MHPFMKDKKNLLLVNVLILITGMAISSCKKDNNEDETIVEIPVNNTVSLTAQTGATLYTAVAWQHTLEEDVHIFTSQSLDGRSITIRMTDLSVGTRNFNFDDPAITYTTGSIVFDAGNAANGSITITSNSGSRISGSFQCTLNNLTQLGTSIDITNGSFNALSYN